MLCLINIITFQQRTNTVMRGIVDQEINYTEVINFINRPTHRPLRTMGPDTYIYKHEEADIKPTIIRYLYMIIQEGQMSIQVVADDTDIFILLVFYCCKCCLQSRNISVHVMKSDGSIIDINASRSTIQLGVQCRDFLAMHVLAGSETTSYPFGKEKMNALKIFPNVELQHVQCIGNLESSSEEIVDAGQKVFPLLYGSKPK